jgi:fructokinase
MTRRPLLGGVELGGTKCVCLFGTGADDIRAQIAIPTGSHPDTTLQRIEEFLRGEARRHGPLEALGIASFGPVDLRPDSPTYGAITSTPKAGWSGTRLVSAFSQAFQIPIGFNTDVNGAALAEGRWGAAQNLKDFAYITVGTGVGVGLVVGGHLAGGFSHPELGHIRIVRRPGDRFAGSCVFHGDCVEGLASGVAIAARTGVPADELATDDGVWDCVAHALAQLLHTLVLATAPRRILIGGGVTAARPELLPRIRRNLVESLSGYLDLERLTGGLDSYVMAPKLGALAGPLGALALAANAI